MSATAASWPAAPPASGRSARSASEGTLDLGQDVRPNRLHRQHAGHHLDRERLVEAGEQAGRMRRLEAGEDDGDGLWMLPGPDSRRTPRHPWRPAAPRRSAGPAPRIASMTPVARCVVERLLEEPLDGVRTSRHLGRARQPLAELGEQPLDEVALDLAHGRPSSATPAFTSSRSSIGEDGSPAPRRRRAAGWRPSRHRSAPRSGPIGAHPARPGSLSQPRRMRAASSGRASTRAATAGRRAGGAMPRVRRSRCRRPAALPVA